MQPRAAELVIIVPGYNESGNLRELVARVHRALEGTAWEMIVDDDDSPDRTAQLARALYTKHPQVRCIRRVGRRGLSSACIEGMLSASAPYLAVMDADLQHDPAALPDMLGRLRSGEADLVLGSRYVAGGRCWGLGRLAPADQPPGDLARWAHARGRPAGPDESLLHASKEVIDECALRLSALGFKILLDIAVSTPASTRIIEIPIRFGQRITGESKLSSNVAFEFLLLVAEKLVGRWLPVRFVAFSVIGALGVLVHFAVLSGAFRPESLSAPCGTTP